MMYFEYNENLEESKYRFRYIPRIPIPEISDVAKSWNSLMTAKKIAAFFTGRKNDVIINRNQVLNHQGLTLRNLVFTVMLFL